MGPGNETFDDRRRVIELLDVGALMTVEDGQKFIDIWCFLGRNKLSVGTTSSQSEAFSKNCQRSTTSYSPPRDIALNAWVTAFMICSR